MERAITSYARSTEALADRRDDGVVGHIWQPVKQYGQTADASNPLGFQQ
jgi:hypothetical protein